MPMFAGIMCMRMTVNIIAMLMDVFVDRVIDRRDVSDAAFKRAQVQLTEQN